MTKKLKNWVNPEIPWKNKKNVPKIPPRILIDYATMCNLRCPMCVVWGSEDERKIDDVKGIMDVNKARDLLDIVMKTKPMIQPNLWGEPLLIPELEKVIFDLKSRNIPVVLNTNGLTLTSKICQLFISQKVDSIMFSVDATTAETLKKVRGIDKLEKIKKAVNLLLKERGDAILPRIGVSFTVQDTNKHEKDDFVKEWLGKVDVIRIGLMFDDSVGNYPEMVDMGKRKPCPALYSTLPIHNDGTARICCLDGFRKTNMGNVYKEGLDKVWNGEEFNKARYYHETGQWDKVPFCENCNGWAEFDYQEEVKDNHLIRFSPQYIYYNKIDKLETWTKETLGDHKEPKIKKNNIKKR